MGSIPIIPAMDLNEYQLSQETAEKPCEKCAINKEECYKYIGEAGFVPCGCEFNAHKHYMVPKQLTDEEIQEKLNKLREERNQHNDEASKLQSEINKWELELHHVPDYTHRYLRINENGSVIYLYVTKVERLFHGIRIHSNITVQIYKWWAKAYIDDELTIDVDYENIHDISIITKEEFENDIKEAFNYVQSLVKAADATTDISNVNIIADIQTTC